MTVADLTRELQKHPQDLEVYVRGYEGGVNEVVQAVPLRVSRYENDDASPIFGQHGRILDLGAGTQGGEPGLEIVGEWVEPTTGQTCP